MCTLEACRSSNKFQLQGLILHVSLRSVDWTVAVLSACISAVHERSRHLRDESRRDKLRLPGTRTAAPTPTPILRPMSHARLLAPWLR